MGSRRPERALVVERLFSANLIACRERQGITRAMLAGRTGLAVHAIEIIENPKRTRGASIGEAVVLAKALGVQPAELLKNPPLQRPPLAGRKQDAG